MEPREKEFIRKNLPELLKETKFRQSMLIKLRAEGFICDTDIDDLVNRRTEYDKVAELYRLLETRTNGYRGLMDALQSENQTGAYNILHKGLGAPQNTCDTTTNQTSVMQANRSDKEIASLVVGSRGCSIHDVLDVMRESLNNGALCHRLIEIAQYLQLDEGTKRNLKRQELSPDVSYVLLCDEILRAWTARQGRNATVGVLGVALEKAHQNSVYDDLKSRFRQI